MPQTALSRNHDVKTYPALLKCVRTTLLEGQQRIEAEKVRTYWETGFHVRRHILVNNGRAEYGKEVVLKLSRDLGVGDKLLYRCVRFYEKYPDGRIFAGRRKLTWSHIRELITVSDAHERARLEKLVGDKGWSSEELAARIKTSRSSAEDANVPSGGNGHPRLTSDVQRLTPLLPLKGVLYTYRIIRRKAVGAGETLMLDLGFKAFRNVEARLISNFSDGDIVQSISRDDAYRFSRTDRTAKDLYTYEAYVEKVVDGDTLNVRIDLGFDMWVWQTLRLRGIDCPEMNTREGAAAKAFVQSLIKEADRIVVRSSRSDKYDRYLADIYLPAAGEGEGEAEVFLNNLLLGKGFAVRWE